MVFDWKSDRNEDVWEFERRINLEESREWPGRQMKRAEPRIAMAEPVDLWISSTPEILNSRRADVFNPKRQQTLTGASVLAKAQVTEVTG